MDVVEAQVGADVVAREILQACDDGEVVPVVDRQVEGAADEGVVEAFVPTARGLQNFSLDKVFLAETGIVMDACGAKDGLAVRPDLALPGPVAGLVGETQIEALIPRPPVGRTEPGLFAARLRRCAGRPHLGSGQRRAGLKPE